MYIGTFATLIYTHFHSLFHLPHLTYHEVRLGMLNLLYVCHSSFLVLRFPRSLNAHIIVDIRGFYMTVSTGATECQQYQGLFEFVCNLKDLGADKKQMIVQTS